MESPLLRLRLVAWAALLATVLGLSVHAFYITRAGADAVYMDTLRLLWQWSEFRHGRLPLLDWWGQQGTAHSGLIFQTVLAANASWFGLDTLLANHLTGVVIASVVLVLSAAYILDIKRSGKVPPVVLAVMVVVTTAMLCFSFSGFEVLTLDLGLGLWLKNALIFVLFLAHAGTLRGKEPGKRAVAALSAYGALVIVLCAMGWSYAVVGAVVGVQSLHHVMLRTWPTASQAALPVSLVSALVAVGIGKRVYFGHVDEVGVGLGTDIVRQWLLSLASTFVNGETVARLGLPTLLLVALGALLALGFVAAAVIRALDRRASLMPVHLIAYASLCALSFVLARGGLGDEAVMASRYHMDVFPGLVGLLWIASMGAQNLVRLPRWTPGAVVVALVGITTVFQAWQARVEWGIAPYRNTAFEAMKQALREGVPNEAAATLLQSPIEHARHGAAVMRRERLAVFRDAPAVPGEAACSVAWGTGEGWYAREQGGTWSSARAVFDVPACACKYRVDIHLPADYSPRTVTLTQAVNPSGKPVATLALVPGRTTSLAIPASATTQRYVLASSRTTIPAQAGLNQDVRALGVYMGQPQVSCPSRAH